MMESDNKKIEVLYLCNGKACKVCNSIAGGECKHTADIRYAKNFEAIENSFWEKDTPPNE